MSTLSRWPLPPDGVRFLTPQTLIKRLQKHPLAQSLFVTAVGYYPQASGHWMERKNHPDHILIYCTAGSGNLEIDGKILRIKGGDFIYLPKGSTHRYLADKTSPWTIYWLHFDGDIANDFYQYVDLADYHCNIGVQPRVIRVFDGVAALRHSSHHVGEFIQGGHQIQALLSYIALLAKQRQPYSNTRLDWESIRAVMQEHIHTKLDLDTLAAEAQLSKYHFAKKFKALTGESPIQYFINMKMQRACYLLDSNPRPIKHIAAELGYEDAYYFSRLFKKTIGLAPEKYRQAKQ